MNTFQPENDEPIWHEFAIMPNADDTTFSTSLTRTYLEDPLLCESGDELTTYDDGTVEQIRNREVVARTRWTKEKPAYMNDEPDDVLNAQIIGED